MAYEWLSALKCAAEVYWIEFKSMNSGSKLPTFRPQCYHFSV